MINQKKILTLLLVLTTICVNAQVMWQIKKDTVVKWYYYDGDEFNGKKVDDQKWIPAYSYAQINYRFDYLMTPKRLEFENGVCKFSCYRDTGLAEIPDWQLDSSFKKEYRSSIVDGNKFRYLFTAGNVWSKTQYSKGYFELRFKTTDAYGMWPAFWLYGTNQKDEIDFFELKGEREKSIHVATHCPKGCDNKYKKSGLFAKAFSGWIKTTADLSKDYNILAGEWQDGYVKWYLNGEGIAYFDGDFASQKMSLIIGNGPAKNGYGFAPGVTKETPFPNSLDVDYVRVWYKDEKTKDNVLGEKHTNFTYLKTEKETGSSLRKKIRYMYNKKAFQNELMTISVLPANGKKILVTSLGKEINYNLSIIDLTGKELSNTLVTKTFNEFDLSSLTQSDKVKIKISTSYTKIEEIVSLQK
ncbi:MAG: glycoside hydrolase family 16 protein [Bacteroidia bacterium]